MPAAKPRYTLDELASLGEAVLARKIRPILRAEDDGKFVAIDVDTGEYEVNEDDYTAVMSLRSRCPEAEIWLARAGFRTAYRIGSLR